ncbi:MAG: hypothetical protein IJC48_06100 [Clostridia bacterium]|nr:hypothetical protein [Clostridia bacterium]MBQ4158997.1 hypothetical protein [Clostridia bacterium]
MKPESAKRVIFRFSKKEVSALMKLMGLEVLPGISIAPGKPDNNTVMSLSESAYVTPLGDRFLVDRVTALIFRSIKESGACIIVRENQRQAVLYKCRHLLVLIENTGSQILKIEPIENTESAKTPWVNVLKGFNDKAEAALVINGEKISEVSGAKEAEELIDRLSDSGV